MDDILIYSKTYEQHLVLVDAVLKRMIQFKTHLKASKCEFAKDTISYIGHVFTRDGIKCDPGKSNAIRLYKRPGNVSDMRSFLGLVGYYRKFIKDFSKVVKPLTDMTKEMSKEDAKKAYSTWTPAALQAFETLKTALMSEPILGHPDWTKEFQVRTDACKDGLGAVLCQKNDDGLERVVAYASRVLRDPETRYHSYEQEMLAVVWAVRYLVVRSGYGISFRDL